jgi:ubiquinone/menaquinone biosynthesis C-methylase UbiE
MDPDTFNAFEAAGWEQRVAGYEDFFGPITTQVVEPLLDAAEVAGGARVLDIASGPGYVASQAAARGAAVVGVDIAEGMLARARRLHPQLDFRQGDAEALPFPDGSFDAVVGNFVLLHVSRPEQATAEFARVLTPGAALRSRSGMSPRRRGSSACSSTRWARQGPVRQRTPAGPPFFRF